MVTYVFRLQQLSGNYSREHKGNLTETKCLKRIIAFALICVADSLDLNLAPYSLYIACSFVRQRRQEQGRRTHMSVRPCPPELAQFFCFV